MLAGLRGVRESIVLVGNKRFPGLSDGDCEPADAAKQIKRPSPVYKTQNQTVSTTMIKMPIHHEVLLLYNGFN
jgi:hypothetical protein